LGGPAWYCRADKDEAISTEPPEAACEGDRRTLLFARDADSTDSIGGPAIRAAIPKEAHVSGVNYFSQSCCLTSECYPIGRCRGWRRGREAPPWPGDSPPALLRLMFRDKESGRWESGKPAFGFPLFHPPSSSELWECGNLAGLWRDSQGTRGKRGKPACGFPRFPQDRHFHSSLTSRWSRH